MDFIISLPISRGQMTIMVTMDQLSKIAHFVAMASRVSANTAAQAYYENVLKLYGVPQSIVSYGDPFFTSSFWKSYFGYKGPGSVSLHPIIHSQTGKRR